MRTIVVPDIHDRVHWIEPFLAHEPHDEVVFLGDYFDSFIGTRVDAQATACWLYDSLRKPNRVHLLGNHDLGYFFQQVDKYDRRKIEWMKCSGNTDKKLKAIREILNGDEKFKLKLLHKTQGFHLSHAGLSEYHFSHPIFGYDRIEQRCQEALEKATMGIYDPLLDAGFARHGNLVVGGILWLDWNDEFVPIEGISQIVGHTRCREKSVRDNHFYFGSYAENLNYCIDTDSQYVAIIEDGEVTFKRTNT